MESGKSISLPIYHVDAFTSTPFTGNPAGVCLLQEPLADEWMQAIAAEMNLSETAFVILSGTPADRINGDFPLRWFTPKNEVPLCGHATLATAAVLYNELGFSAPSVRFHTKSGVLTAKKVENRFTLDFPADQPELEDSDERIPLLNAMGIGKYQSIFRGKRTGKYVIHLPTEEDVVELKPDFAQMMAAAPSLTGVGVTAQGTGDYDIISRYFNPWFGVNEEPVTGTVHTILAPYWAGILHKKEMHAVQASSRRGEIYVALDEAGRCLLTGDAVVLMHGEIRIRG